MQEDFRASRALLLARSPFDIMPSYFNIIFTVTHTRSITNNVQEEMKDLWDRFLVARVELLKNFFSRWQERMKEMPVYCYRFEDLISDQRKEMAGIYQFMLGLESIEGTFIEKRIKDQISQNDENSGIYKPRSGKFNASLHWFTKEQIDFVNRELRDYLIFFGYV